MSRIQFFRPGRQLLLVAVLLLTILILLASSSSSSALPAALVWSWESNIANTYAGYQSAGKIGDLNGDGYDDVCVSALSSSKAYVFYGSSSGPATTPDWIGSAAGSYGYCDGADVNADGYSDLLVGASLYNGSQYTQQGAVFVYYGSASGIPAAHDLLIEGFAPYSRFGPVSNAGDVNNDGYEDIVVGALWDNGYNGKAYIFYGSATGLDRSNRSDIYNPNTAAGCGSDDYFANVVSQAGDVNGDGYGDVLISAPNDKCVIFDEGVIHVYLGSASGIAATPQLTIRGGHTSLHLSSGAPAGDVNGDGFDDFTVGSNRYDSGGLNDRGIAQLFLGGPGGPDAVPDWTMLGEAAGSGFGYGPTEHGDFNGDGYGDVIIGAWSHNGAGRAYLFLGSAAGLATSPAWLGEGENAGDYYGVNVHTVGDVMNRGYDAFMVGASSYGSPETNEGKAYIYYLDRPLNEYLFNYTITADGTEDVTTYPERPFSWTAALYGTETRDYETSRYVYNSGCNDYHTAYLSAASGTATGWHRSSGGSSLGGRDNGTYLSGNTLVIRTYTGGHTYSYCCEYLFFFCTRECTGCDEGYFGATYYLQSRNSWDRQVTRHGTGRVKATDGNKFIGSFDNTIYPVYGGSTSVHSTRLSDNDAHVSSWISGSDQVYASTGYSETEPVPWQQSESGTARIKAEDGAKQIATSTLVAPNNDTTWSVVDDNDDVLTWMTQADLFAQVKGGFVAISKETIPAGSTQRFTFSGDLGTFDLAAGETWNSAEVPALSYELLEDPLDDWQLVDGSCSEARTPPASEISPTQGTAAIHVDPGETVTCTFVNESLHQIRLVDSGGSGLPGATAKYYSGGWKTIPGETNAEGKLYYDIPDGTYKFRLTYLGGTMDLTQDIGAEPIVTYRTTRVTARMQDTAGMGLPDGVVKYYAGGWKEFGTTGADGSVSKELLPLSYKFRMTYLGGTLEQTQDVAVDPLVLFQTAEDPITVILKDSLGNGLAGGVVSYYAGGWKPFGTTGADGVAALELLPDTYKFKIVYLGGAQQLTQDVELDQQVNFATIPVTVRMQDSAATGLSGGVVTYYAGGWRDFGTTGADGSVSKELLPLSYKFRMTYLGGALEQTQDVAVDPLVLFQTADNPITVRLQDSLGSPLNGGVVKYYAGGWKPFGTTGDGGTDGETSLDLPPKSYKFRLTYLGGVQQLTQDVAVDQRVRFSTIPVSVELRNHLGDLLDEPGTLTYYAGGWKPLGDLAGGTASKQLLPLSYKVKLLHMGGTAVLTQDISVQPLVTFQTGAVTCSTCTHYYAGGWKAFSDGMQLLPGDYKFRFNDGTPDTIVPIAGGVVNPVP